MSRSGTALEAFFKISLVGFLVIGIGLPLLLYMALQGAFQGALFGPVDPVGLAENRSGVITKFDADQIHEQKAKLARLASYEGEAAATSSELRVLVLNYEGDAALGGVGDQVNGFRQLSLNIGSAKRTGVLVLAGQPLRLKVTNSKSPRRAVLALEGTAPIDVVDGTPGLLAGHRLAVYGARRVSQPGDYLQQISAKRFCASLRAWRRHFDVKRRAVRVEAIHNATSITVTDRNIYHNGNRIQDAPAVDFYCRRW